MATGEKQVPQMTEVTTLSVTDLMWIILGGTSDGFISYADMLTALALDLDFVAAVNFNPGSDTDIALLDVDVTGTPKVTWDESDDQFELTHGLELLTGDFDLTAGNLVLLAGQAYGPVAENTITYAASITPDLDEGQHQVCTLTGDVTINNPSNIRGVTTFSIHLIQDATGSRILTLGSYFKTAGGAGITLSTAANAEDVLHCQVISATEIIVSATLDFS